MNNANHERIVYYGSNDYTTGFLRDRCVEKLVNSESMTISTINDAIEVYQCKLMVEGVPELFEGIAPRSAEKSANQLFSKACRFVNLALLDEGVDTLYEQVELQYWKLFWQFVEVCDALRKIRPADLEKLLERHPNCIGTILESKKFTSNFDNELKQTLLQNKIFAAELIISRLATDSGSRMNLRLPDSLKNSEIDTIMLNYTDSEKANPNYLAALCNWPTGTSRGYSPSPEVRVLAKQKYESSLQELFLNGTILNYSTGVTIDMNQTACRGFSKDRLNVSYSFSGQWLEKYTDSATIMNNLLYVFDFIGANGLMFAPARKHEESALLKAIGLPVIGEYRKPADFQRRDGLILLETRAYADFLEAHGTRLENAIEWVYNEYFSKEFDIRGFTLSLPAKDASWLDKCKSIGPEIERAIKGYSVYAKRGKIDDAFFPYENVKSFSSVKSLGKKKYAVAGPKLERLGYMLFSDQCMLSYLHKTNESEPCFLDMMRRHQVTRNDYAEYLQTPIDELIKAELIFEEDENGKLQPTPRVFCIKIVWDYDALAMRRLGKANSDIIDSLVNNGILGYCDQLFSPTEAAYFDYMFNNASFPNSLALRNKYDHAHASVMDPQAEDIRNDYYRLLSMLICITLKINEELMDKTGLGGVDNFVDWPYYDESILQYDKSRFQIAGER